MLKERVVRDVQIRGGKVIVVSSIPNSEPCSAGGSSFLQEMDACTGGRLTKAQFDLNNDGVIDDNDLITIEISPGVFITVAPTSIGYDQDTYAPTILTGQGGQEVKLMSTAAGGIQTLIEQGEQIGTYYWLQF